MGLTNICVLFARNNLDRKILKILLILLANLYKLIWQLIWYMNVSNLLNSFLNYFLWLLIYLCKSHVVKFIISLTSFIQILVCYLLEVSLITSIVTSFVSFLSKISYSFSIFPKKKKRRAYYKIKEWIFAIKKLWY